MARVQWNEKFGVFEVLIGNDYPEEFGKILAAMAKDEDVHLIGANTAYDTVVATYHDPVRCISPFFEAYAARGRIHRRAAFARSCTACPRRAVWRR